MGFKTKWTLFPARGEEFEVVVRGVDEPAALRLAEAIREQIAALQFEQGPKVSASLGVALSHANEALSSLGNAPTPPLIKRSKREEIAFNLRPEGLSPGPFGT